jgi:hypothetical protein
MPAKSAADVAKRMQQVGEAARKAQNISVTRAAMAMKVVHLAGLAQDVPSGRLRNVGKGGAKVGVRYKLHGTSASPTAIVEATGPWQIINNPAVAHVIVPKKKKALHFGSSLFRASVQHPGHRGKQTWQRAEPAAAEAGTKQLNSTMVNAVQQAFKK